MDRDRLDDVVLALRYSLGVTAVAAGADKFANVLTDWEKYLSPEVEERLPLDGRAFMKLAGVVEMAVGAAVLTRRRWAPWAAGAWLCCIAADLVVNRDYDIAVRDLNMAVGAFALARLERVRAQRRIHPEQTINPDTEPQVA